LLQAVEQVEVQAQVLTPMAAVVAARVDLELQQL
jgi:hypothetical protein